MNEHITDHGRLNSKIIHEFCVLWNNSAQLDITSDITFQSFPVEELTATFSNQNKLKKKKS